MLHGVPLNNFTYGRAVTPANLIQRPIKAEYDDSLDDEDMPVMEETGARGTKKKTLALVSGVVREYAKSIILPFAIEFLGRSNYTFTLCEDGGKSMKTFIAVLYNSHHPSGPAFWAEDAKHIYTAVSAFRSYKRLADGSISRLAIRPQLSRTSLASVRSRKSSGSLRSYRLRTTSLLILKKARSLQAPSSTSRCCLLYGKR
jgi:hypothetical protein